MRLTHQWVDIIPWFFSHSYLCAWTVYLVSTLDPSFLVAGRWIRGGRTAWSGYSAVGMMCRHLLNCNIELCSDQCLVSVRFLHSTIMDCYFILRIFPVSACPISLHMYLSYGCVGLSVRRSCCEFLVCCHWNRLSNSDLHYEFTVLYFWLFSFAWDPSISFQSHFCCSYYFVYSFLFGIRLCWLLL